MEEHVSTKRRGRALKLMLFALFLWLTSLICYGLTDFEYDCISSSPELYTLSLFDISGKVTQIMKYDRKVFYLVKTETTKEVMVVGEESHAPKCAPNGWVEMRRLVFSKLISYKNYLVAEKTIPLFLFTDSSELVL